MFCSECNQNPELTTQDILKKTFDVSLIVEAYCAPQPASGEAPHGTDLAGDGDNKPRTCVETHFANRHHMARRSTEQTWIGRKGILCLGNTDRQMTIALGFQAVSCSLTLRSATTSPAGRSPSPLFRSSRKAAVRPHKVAESLPHRNRPVQPPCRQDPRSRRSLRPNGGKG